MDNQDLNTVLRKLQDQLDENDRQRMILLLNEEKSNSVDREHLLRSPIDLNQLNETQLENLVKFFEEIHCHEAIDLLKSFKRSSHQIPSTNCKSFRTFLMKSS